MNTQTLKNELLPSEKPRMIDLVAAAGFNVADWANYAGGPDKAAANPKYCYEWCYEQEGMFLLNLWYENMLFERSGVFQKLNLRGRPTDIKGIRKARAKRFDAIVERAFLTGSHPRAIIQHRSSVGSGGVETRLLDKAPWTVTDYNTATGDFVLRRGIAPVASSANADPELESFREGQQRDRFIRHRHREARLREAKISEHAKRNAGRLPCEVPNCCFDFEATYGDLGRQFAHVHHLKPLAEADADGYMTTLADMAVVCANCHAMIHRGGDCRPLKDVSPMAPVDV